MNKFIDRTLNPGEPEEKRWYEHHPSVTCRPQNKGERAVKLA
ncbi:MAG: hypothetical protein V7K57_10615 [Nostoc sp.]